MEDISQNNISLEIVEKEEKPKYNDKWRLVRHKSRKNTEKVFHVTVATKVKKKSN